jgi:hypothetical protein
MKSINAPKLRMFRYGFALCSGEDINLHLFAIRVLEDEVRYEVKLSGAAEHKTVKPPEWLSLCCTTS